MALLARIKINVAQGGCGGRDRIIWQRFVHGGARGQVARSVPGVQAHGLHVTMIGSVGGSGDGVLVTRRAIDRCLTWRIVKGQRRGYTCPGGGA